MKEILGSYFVHLFIDVYLSVTFRTIHHTDEHKPGTPLTFTCVLNQDTKIQYKGKKKNNNI